MLKINSQKETKKIVKFIRDTLKKQGFNRLVLGLSGGVDSATCAFLASKAIGQENLYILLTPYEAPQICKNNNQSFTGEAKSAEAENLKKACRASPRFSSAKADQNQDMSLARKVIKKLKIPSENVIKTDITSPVDNLINTINNSLSSKSIPACCDRNTARLTKKQKSTTPKSPKYSIPNTKYYLLKANLIARVRMIVTFDLAKRLNALVCGTENRSEHLLGYFTRYGDSASDIEPIRHLYKTQIYQLAKNLRVPQEVIQARPTAGLWPGQTDEKELGFSYEEADIVLHLYFDKHLTEDGIAKFPSAIRYGASISRPSTNSGQVSRRLQSKSAKGDRPLARAGPSQRLAGLWSVPLAEKSANQEIVRKVLKRVKENLFKHRVPYSLSPSS